MRNRHLPRSPSGNTIGTDRASLAIRALRRKTVSSLSLAMLGVAALAFPFALLGWSGGSVAPVVICLSGLGLGSLALANARIGRTGRAILIQTSYIAGSGLVLSVLEPLIIDLGLGLMILAIMHAALFCDRASSRNTFVLMAALAAFAATSALSLTQFSLETMSPLGIAALLNTVSVVCAQTYFAVRLHRVMEMHKKSHDSATQHLLEHMGDGYVRFSRGGVLIFSSRATGRTLGATAYELAGIGFSQRVHVSDRPVFLKGISDALHSGQTKIIEVRIRKDDPEHRAQAPKFLWIELFLSPVSNTGSNRSEPELVALLRDITPRKDHELEMSSARKEAEEASQTKSRFLATIGHELRTPLNAIVGFSEMMSNGIGGDLEPVHKDYAQLIQQSGHHLLDVVNMLLDMSRIEAGKFELQLARFGPERLVEPCLRMIESSAAERNITLASNIEAALPALIGDERACRQILINLLSNAIKFSNENSEVTISIRRQGQNIALCVADTGIGMTAEDAQRIGEPFFQAHGELNRQYEGTGLGLSIVKGLVELHGGSLQVNSKVNHGTRVTAFLPINGPEIDNLPADNVSSLRSTSSKSETSPWPEQKRIAQ